MILCFTFLWCIIPDRLPCPLRISSNFSLPDTKIKVIKVFRSQNLKKKTLPDEYLQNRIFVHSDMMMDSGWRRRKGNWGERRKKKHSKQFLQSQFFSWGRAWIQCPVTTIQIFCFLAFWKLLSTCSLWLLLPSCHRNYYLEKRSRYLKVIITFRAATHTANIGTQSNDRLGEYVLKCFVCVSWCYLYFSYLLTIDSLDCHWMITVCTAISFSFRSSL